MRKVEMDENFGRLMELLEAHRRFHQRVGCPGRPECLVCAEEEWFELHNREDKPCTEEFFKSIGWINHKSSYCSTWCLPVSRIEATFYFEPGVYYQFSVGHMIFPIKTEGQVRTLLKLIGHIPSEVKTDGSKSD